MIRLQDRKTDGGEYDAIRPDGSAIAEIKCSVDALRTVRTALIKLAYSVERHPPARGYLVLIEPKITRGRLYDEWHRAAAVLKPKLLDRLSICFSIPQGGFRGVPVDPPQDVQKWLSEVVECEAGHVPGGLGRPDYEFIIIKILIHRWLTSRESVTTKWLAHTAGCSYPTVSRVLRGLGSMIKRESDRSIGLRFFPQKEFSMLVAMSERARSTTRFVDRSGQSRNPEAHLRRLEKLRPEGIAIGGVLGAKYYVPELDLVGTPRLDLSLRCHNAKLDFAIIDALDPALEREDDPLKPANVVVHAVRHAEPLFASRVSGLAWADPVECLLDLHEAHLEAQASQFLMELERRHEQ